MPANQKPLNRLELLWYQFTPREILYHMVSVNFVKFGPHGLSGIFWATLYNQNPFHRNVIMIATDQTYGDNMNEYFLITLTNKIIPIIMIIMIIFIIINDLVILVVVVVINRFVWQHLAISYHLETETKE